MDNYPHISTGKTTDGHVIAFIERNGASVGDIVSRHFYKKESVAKIADDLLLSGAEVYSAIAHYYDNIDSVSVQMTWEANGIKPTLATSDQVKQDDSVVESVPNKWGVYWARSFDTDTRYNLIVGLSGEPPFLRVCFAFRFPSYQPVTVVPEGLYWGPKIEMPDISKNLLRPVGHQITE